MQSRNYWGYGILLLCILAASISPVAAVCYHYVYAYDDTSKGLANVPTQVFGSNSLDGYNVGDQIDGGITDSNGYIGLMIPDSALSTWRYFYINNAGIVIPGYSRIGWSGSTGVAGDPDFTPYYTPQYVCGGTSEFWYSKATTPPPTSPPHPLYFLFPHTQSKTTDNTIPGYSSITAIIAILVYLLYPGKGNRGDR